MYLHMMVLTNASMYWHLTSKLFGDDEARSPDRAYKARASLGENCLDGINLSIQVSG